jgi:choline monooxygenase
MQVKPVAPKTLPASVYRDPDIYERERRLIFARSWLLAIHQAQIPRPGDSVSITAAGYPLIVLRSQNGSIRAFHNVCRHRAGPLVVDESGRRDQLVCQYHGWRYDLTGKLTNTPDFGAAEGFDPKNNGLFPVNCGLWRGFVFINMDTNPEPLDGFVAPLQTARNVPFEQFRVIRTSSHTLACNWKTYAENYVETYHIPRIHPFLNSAVDSNQFDIRISPPAILYEAPKRENTPVSGFWAWLWPCLCVNGYADSVLMERIWPVSVNETRLDYLYCFPEGVSSKLIEETIAASETTTQEDKAICEAVQRNLNAGVYDQGLLSPTQEAGVAWLQDQVRRVVLD